MAYLKNTDKIWKKKPAMPSDAILLHTIKSPLLSGSIFVFMSNFWEYMKRQNHLLKKLLERLILRRPQRSTMLLMPSLTMKLY